MSVSAEADDRFGQVGYRIPAIALASGCRANHSKLRCINWSWDTTTTGIVRISVLWETSLNSVDIPPHCPTPRRVVAFQGFARQPRDRAVATRAGDW